MFDSVNLATGEVFRTVAEVIGGRRARRAGRRTRVRGLGRADADPAREGAHRFADLIEEHAEELALIETRDMGMAIGDVRAGAPGTPR